MIVTGARAVICTCFIGLLLSPVSRFLFLAFWFGLVWGLHQLFKARYDTSFLGWFTIRYQHVFLFHLLLVFVCSSMLIGIIGAMFSCMDFEVKT